MSIQAGWNSLLRVAAGSNIIGKGQLKVESQPQPLKPEEKGPADADVYKALAENRGQMLIQETQKRREAELALIKAQQAAQEEDSKPENTIKGSERRIKKLSEVAPKTLAKEEREDRIRSALEEAFGIKREEGIRNG